MVLKAAGPWLGAVAALLRHLEAVGFDAAPRLARPQPEWHGRLAVEFVEGRSPHPGPWRDDQLHEVGGILRRLHDATGSFRPPAAAKWNPVWIRGVGGSDEVIGHCDAAPWNIVGVDGRAQVLIDWEYAGPIDRLTELAYAVWLNAQLHDDDIAERQGLADARTRAAHAAAIADGYGLSKAARIGLVDRIIEVAVRSARAEAVMHDVRPESTNAVDESGYPVLWAIAWRARSAAWLLDHRRLLERSLLA